jgi:RNA polymerase sigma factor (sigma-70 family)
MDLTWEQIYARLERDRNDTRTWQALEHRVHAWAARTLWHCGWDAVQDLVADTCSTVALDFDHARGPSTFAGFVLGVGLNARRCLLRARQAPVMSLDDLELDPPQPEPDEAPDEDQLARLRDAVELLPIREQRAVELRYLEDLPMAAIGQALGVSEGNARRILFNARRHLRRLMEGREMPAAGLPVRVLVR